MRVLSIISDFKAILKALKNDPHDLICEILPERYWIYPQEKGFQLEDNEIEGIRKICNKNANVYPVLDTCDGANNICNIWLNV